MAKDERNTYMIQNDSSFGEVQIADDVVSSIASFAATEVEGVASLAGNTGGERSARFSMKTLSRAVKVDVLEGVATISIALNLKYNFNIMDVCAKVQEKVKNAVENMTGFDVADVNIKIIGMEM